jgi:hypothetical protein
MKTPHALSVLSLNKAEVLRLHFRLSQLHAVGGRLVQIMTFIKRLLKVWSELAAGEPEAIAAAIPVDETRSVPVTPEELAAITDGLVRLMNSEKLMRGDGTMIDNTVGIKLEIARDTELFGAAVARHVMKRLGAEKIEPFVADLDEDEDGDDETPSDTLIDKVA